MFLRCLLLPVPSADRRDFIYYPLSSSFSPLSTPQPLNFRLLLFGTGKARIRDAASYLRTAVFGSTTGMTRDSGKGLKEVGRRTSRLNRTQTRPMWVPLINRVYRVLFLALYEVQIKYIREHKVIRCERIRRKCAGCLVQLGQDCNSMEVKDGREFVWRN